MSDDEKKNGNEKIASLVNRARQKFNKPETDVAHEHREDSLELDVEDPTRPQETPATLNEDRDDLELDADRDSDDKQENFLGRMTMLQRLILVGVVMAVGFVGYNSMTGAGSDLAYLNQAESGQTQEARTGDIRQEPSGAALQATDDTQNDGLEPIAQGAVAADSNAIDLTPGSTVTDAQSAFSLDPIESEIQSADSASRQSVSEDGVIEDPSSELMATPDFGSGNDSRLSGGDSDGSVTDSDLGDDGDIASGPATDQMSFEGGVVPAPARQDGDFGSLDGSSTVTPAEVEDIRDKLKSLNSVVSSLSQSVSSIENEISDSSRGDEALRKEVRALMSELKVRDQKVRSLIDRPELSDLVIFRAAANCSACVPHALFNWNGADVEVGDGLQWQGFSVAIRGDRLSLIKGDDEYHYWYR